jgi:hypothetical protein
MHYLSWALRQILIVNKPVRHCLAFKGTVGTRLTHPSTYIDDCDQQSRGIKARLAAVDDV